MFRLTTISSTLARTGLATARTPASVPIRAMSSQQPRFSKGSDERSMTAALNPLLNSSGGRWALTKEGEALERTFKFKNFAKTWDFMTAVSLQCKLKNHHPEWSNVYNTTFIRWTTHTPHGLSDKDVTLAGICDALARDFGEVIEAPAETPTPSATEASCAMGGLADSAAAASGNCCGQK
ncbi:pterin-4-alpha-carbinolamine dehydratase family protein [Plectosphaerella plurivora]|uniref:4a-hydroxytetrahydrobiopterin dehydratase n=1 Tax=Plectosphaerella plurivora TaxID=936078 RepID=A0A9P9AAX9_9PEZI|nr:pterin-4-alpha-carbinolamine dehydratase family protein [Plectosphaerella plurivora]